MPSARQKSNEKNTLPAAYWHPACLAASLMQDGRCWFFASATASADLSNRQVYSLSSAHCSASSLFTCAIGLPLHSAPTLPGHHPATATLQHDTLRAPPPFLGKAEPAVCRCGGRPQAVAVRGTPLHAEQWGTVAAARSHAFTAWYALHSGRHDETPPCLLSSAEDDVAHGHGQRCTRPWTTLHTAVDNAHGDIS